MATNRDKILKAVANDMSTTIVLVPVLDSGDRNQKASDVPRAGVTAFYEALASEVPLIQPTRKAYMQSEVVMYFVSQNDGGDKDALDKIEDARASAVEFLTRLKFNASVTVYPLGEAVTGERLDMLYDDTDTLLCGVVLTCTMRFDPAYTITACDV